MRVILAWGLICSSLVFADWAKIRSTEFEMKAPPKEGSAAYEKDYQLLHEFESTREDRECELAGAMLFPSFDAFFGPPGELLSKKELGKARALVGRTMKFSERVAGYFKNQFERERPYTVDSSLTPCIETPGGSKSYPSSHAVAASVGACVLAEIFPESVQAIEARGKYMGDLRAIVGVHHPSDVKAGQDLAQDICERLLSESDFVEALNSL